MPALLLIGAPALAEPRDLCPERPGLDTPPCIVEPGRVVVETSAIDWTLDRQPGSRMDTVLVGDLLARAGVSDRLEAQLGWTAYGQVRTRNAAGVQSRSGTGDAMLALKLGLLHPDGQGTSLALQPFVTLPIGGRAIGAGTWGAGLRLPVSVAVGEQLQLLATPEIDAAPDGDGRGRHLSWGSAAGVQLGVGQSIGLAIEGELIRDCDPAGHSTEALGEASLAWQPGANSQLDMGVIAGLDRGAPDLELVAGIARRF